MSHSALYKYKVLPGAFVYVTAGMQVSQSLCSSPVVVPKNVLILSLIIIIHGPQLNEPSVKGLLVGLVRGQGG